MPNKKESSKRKKNVRKKGDLITKPIAGPITKQTKNNGNKKFNIIKEVTTNRDNRDIFKLVLNELDDQTKVDFFCSFVPKENRLKTKICAKCFKFPIETRQLRCSMSCFSRNRCLYYCDNCWSDHIDKNTKITKITVSYITSRTKAFMCHFEHCCKFSLAYSYYQKLKVHNDKYDLYLQSPSLLGKHAWSGKPRKQQ